MDKATIKNKIKEEIIEELKYGDSVVVCCDNILDELPSEEVEDEDKLADIVFEEWRNYADKIEEFLKTLD